MTRKLFNVECGDRVVIDGIVYVLDAMVGAQDGRRDEADDFQFRDIRVGRLTIFSEEEFLRLYERGGVRILAPTERLTDTFVVRHSAKAEDPLGDQRASAAAIKAHMRLRYTLAYDEAPVPLSTKSLTSFIAATAERLGDPKPPSAGSVRRWIKSRGGPGARRLAQMIGRHPKGPQGSRLHPRVQQILEEEAEDYWGSIRVSARKVWEEVTHRINEENATAPPWGDGLMVRPAESTVARWLKENLNYDRAKRRWGPQEALRRFGVIKGSMIAESLLDVAIIDHTILDCWIVDDHTFQPIGRPRLTVVMDSCSRMVLGFDLGWEDAGLDAVLAALRHAVKPKTYLKAQYPELPYDWPAYGQPRTIVPDQGLEFMGTTFEDVCANLGISIEPAPVRSPEYKGQIERFFRTLNTALIHKMPGSVPLKPQQLREFGIDPAKTAVLYLSDAIELIHKWIVADYSRTVHEGIGKAPAKAWQDRLATDVIELCPNLEELERVCGRRQDVRLTREGIKMHRNLVYRSPELAALREDVARSAPQKGRSKQGGVTVRVTYHSHDLSKIYVWNPRTNTSLEVPCIAQTYTRGLSEQLHRHILKFTDASNAAFQSETDMVAARIALYRRMEEMSESRVRDRKRLQKMRHPERDAQRDLVQFELVGRNGDFQSVDPVEVGVHTVSNRADPGPREARPLLRSASKKRPSKDGSRRDPQINNASLATARSRPHTTFDFAKAVKEARQQRGGGVAD